MATRRSSRPPQRRQHRPAPRQRRQPKPGFWQSYLDKRKQKEEFKPDSLEPGFFKNLYMTRLQRLHLLRWVLYVAVCMLLLIIQDVIMSSVTIFGSTTDLGVAIILLITVMEGSDVGSIFVIIASTVYYFTGSSPGAFSIGLLTVLGILATLFRQGYWHRNKTSIILCAGISMMLYELGVYVGGLVQGLTNWYRIDTFLITGVLSWIVMIPLYPLIDRIGQIGGHVWKE